MYFLHHACTIFILVQLPPSLTDKPSACQGRCYSNGRGPRLKVIHGFYNNKDTKPYHQYYYSTLPILPRSKRQAPHYKYQNTSTEPQHQITSFKPQEPNHKRQTTNIKPQTSNHKHQITSIKPQTSNRKRQIQAPNTYKYQIRSLNTTESNLAEG